MNFTIRGNYGLQLALAGIDILIQTEAIPAGIKLAAALVHAGIAAVSSLIAHKKDPKTGTTIHHKHLPEPQARPLV